jgi:hypothetical protein
VINTKKISSTYQHQRSYIGLPRNRACPPLRGSSAFLKTLLIPPTFFAFFQKTYAVQKVLGRIARKGKLWKDNNMGKMVLRSPSISNLL